MATQVCPLCNAPVPFQGALCNRCGVKPRSRRSLGSASPRSRSRGKSGLIITGLLGVLCLTILALVVPCYFRASAAQAASPPVHSIKAVKRAPAARHSASHHRTEHRYRF